MKNDELTLNTQAFGNWPAPYRSHRTSAGMEPGKDVVKQERVKPKCVKIKLPPLPAAPRKVKFPPLAPATSVKINGTLAQPPTRRPWWKFW